MKLFNGLVLISQADLNTALKDAEKTASEKARKQFETEYSDKFESFEKTITSRNKTIKNLREDMEDLENDKNTQIDKLQAKVDVLEEDRDEVRDVVKQSMENEDKAAVLEQAKEQLDARAAKLKTREASIDSQEESNYKKGYADGVADGVRKISEITQSDRDNAMKIAMVSAASHTPVANIKEINDELRLTEGSAKKSEV